MIGTIRQPVHPSVSLGSLLAAMPADLSGGRSTGESIPLVLLSSKRPSTWHPRRRCGTLRPPSSPSTTGLGRRQLAVAGAWRPGSSAAAHLSGPERPRPTARRRRAAPRLLPISHRARRGSRPPGPAAAATNPPRRPPPARRYDLATPRSRDPPISRPPDLATPRSRDPPISRSRDLATALSPSRRTRSRDCAPASGPRPTAPRRARRSARRGRAP
jgi:hypothetical protein